MGVFEASTRTRVTRHTVTMLGIVVNTKAVLFRWEISESVNFTVAGTVSRRRRAVSLLYTYVTARKIRIITFARIWGKAFGKNVGDEQHRLTPPL